MASKILAIGDGELLSRVDASMSRIRAGSQHSADAWEKHCASVETTIANAVEAGELGLADVLSSGLIYQDLVRRGMVSVHMPEE